MITFPNAKINLGLNIVEKRPDGYHNLETIFYPVHLEDALEITELSGNENKDFELHASGITIAGNAEDNLIVKAYRLLKQQYHLPPLDIYLYKKIPSGAGLGGGSSDAAFMLKLLNSTFHLDISDEKLEEQAALLGADCAFFIKNKPVFAYGIGNLFEQIELQISNMYLVIVKPDIFVSTKDAFSLIKPLRPQLSLKEIIKKPVSQWEGLMVNDFEKSVFSNYPEIGVIKEELYKAGAVYAAMSGSGSSVFGLFDTPVALNAENFGKNSFIWSGKL